MGEETRGGLSMKIDKRNDEVVEITLNGWKYTIDDSTGEKIVSRWPVGDDESTDKEKDNYFAQWVEYGHNVPGFYRLEDGVITLTEDMKSGWGDTEENAWRTVENTVGQSKGIKALYGVKEKEEVSV